MAAAMNQEEQKGTHLNQMMGGMMTSEQLKA